MDILNELFGRTFACECDRVHVLRPHEVVIADHAESQVPALVRRYSLGRDVVTVMDKRTAQAAGGDVMEMLRGCGMEVRLLLVEDPAAGRSPVCDDITKAQLQQEIGQAPDLFFAVGSGVINDLTKWIAFEAERPYLVFATAASMNGYTSANVAPAIEGVKTLVRARPPQAVLTSVDVLRNAPKELTSAGLGDVLAKSVSSMDWLVNHVMFGDYYCDYSVRLVADLEPVYLDNPEGIAAGRPASLEALFGALCLTGAAMTMAETSAPASGAEHLVSHCLDMMAGMDGSEHDLHGRQVGVGTVLASEVYRRVLKIDRPELRPPAERDIDRHFWGELSPVVAEQFEQKAPRMEQARRWLAQDGNWQNLRERLQAMHRLPGVTRECLRRAGAAWRAEDLQISRDRLLQAFIHGPEMRSRFTVMDLGYLLGVLPEQSEEIVTRWG